MSRSIISEERNIANSLIAGLANLPNTPTREQVENFAKILAETFGYEGDLRNIINEALISVDTRMGTGVSLVDVAAQHDDQWVDKRSDISWTYSSAYEKFLQNSGWAPQMVQAMSDVTYKILGHLQDPTSEGTTWSRRGLVIGHVQSGKTANYTGLISRAADAGYKFIVVIAGIHNNLRKQTQHRIDEAFIGRSSDPSDRKPIGVGLDSLYPNPATLTNVFEDFNKNTAAKSGWKINDFSKPIVLVIKKNVSTLTSLHNWLKELNAEGNGRISDIPMLIIDDEADNASINTNKEELDPTKTNSLIRRILKLFAKSCYVGYTATPFANIFINPDAYDEEVQEELFPEHFIYSLDAPTSYFGAEKVFVNEESSEKVIRSIDDAEDIIPFSHKRDDEIQGLPESLYLSVNEFIVARAIRNLRGQKNKHCSMMVNVSRFVPIQNLVKNFLSLRVKKIREAVSSNYAMPEEIASKNEYMSALEDTFNTEYFDCGYEWAEVKRSLYEVFENLRIFVINSKSSDVLDYERYEKDGIGLTAIAIGGLSLSRGLTIEGLTISYMYRNTKMYDTLMQMGRWFGYRPGYEDLCRIHLSRDSIDWYSHIAEASEEVIQQIKRMQRDNLSPKDFGLYVKSHPDTLLVTAANKMRAGQEVIVEQSYSGSIWETSSLPTEDTVNQRNFELIKQYWRNGFGNVPEVIEKKGIFFKDVAIEQIENFLTNFECYSTVSVTKSYVLSYLEKVATKYPFADVLLVSPPNGSGGELPFTLRNQERAVASEIPEGGPWKLNKNRVASRGDEKIGLTDEQIAMANVNALAKSKDDKLVVSDADYRRVRNKPLLMIHSLMPKSDSINGPIAAIGLSFPYEDQLTTVRIVANRIWLQQMIGFKDDPSEEEELDV